MAEGLVSVLIRDCDPVAQPIAASWLFHRDRTAEEAETLAYTGSPTLITSSQRGGFAAADR
jgi:hypothetical protein